MRPMAAEHAGAATAASVAVAKTKTKPMKAAAPKVTTDDMREAQPLYVEPEERDEVTDAAAEITAAATAAVPVAAGGGSADEARPGGEAQAREEGRARGIRAAPDARRAAGTQGARRPREGDDNQEVGPTK